MKDVAQYTRVTPNQRMNALRQYLQNIQKSEGAQRVLGEWGLRMDTNAVDLRARQLENEVISFGGGATVQAPNADWNRAIGENKITGPVDLYDWILFYTDRDSKYAKDFAQTICRLGGVMGCRIVQPQAIRLPDDRNETYMQACKDNINRNTQVRK